MHELSVKSLNNDFSPDPPKTVEETQLDFGFLADLVLKTVYADTNCTTARAAEKLCLPLPMTETLLQHLYREKLVEIRGIESFQNHRYALLDRGWQRANRLLDLNGYIGRPPFLCRPTRTWSRGRGRTEGRCLRNLCRRPCPNWCCLRLPGKPSVWWSEESGLHNS